MSRSIVMITPATAEIEPKAEAISRHGVLSGTPEMRTKSVARSHDWTSNMVIWECTAGSFNWHYSQDEMLVIVSGEAVITTQKGEERLLGLGDFAYFPAGMTCAWRVPHYVRKVAIVRETIWRPLGFGLKAFNKLLRLTHLKGKSPF
jgi:uncharacterized cupin superfamily protein